MPILEFHHIARHYRGNSAPVIALNNISFALSPNEFVVVQGPSGCGKTTLLLTAGALLSPDCGEVRIEGANPYALDPEARAAVRARSIGFVFQQFHLVPYLSVQENMMASAMAAPANDARARAQELIEQFGLSHRADHRPGQLSTGERQRTALGRALMNRPKLLLADEPTGNLDEENARIVLDCLANFAQSGGAVLMVTHGRCERPGISRTIQMQAGRIVNRLEEEKE